MLSHFDHVTIAVAEPEAAAKLYSKLLGNQPVWRGEHAELGTSAALFGVGNALIELVGPRAGAPESDGLRAFLATHGDGLSALAFGTTDAAQLHGELRERGLRCAPPADGVAEGHDGGTRSYRVVELSPRSTRGVAVYAVERPDFAALSAPSEPAASTVCALDHVVLRSADADAALALYGQKLGLRLALDQELFGTRMLFFRVGHVTLEVIVDPTASEHDALWGVAYRVRDLAAAHARLQAAGVPVGELREGRKPGTHVFSVQGGACSVPTLFLRDPVRE